MITEEQIRDNYDRFMKLLEKEFLNEFKNEKRYFKLKIMYDDLRSDLISAPASIYKSYHNCFPGGYLDHVLRVYDFSMAIYNVLSDLCDFSFTREELAFVALNHDVGKLGDGKYSLYIENKNEWYIKNQGKFYEINDKIDYMLLSDRSIFLLNKYSIEMSANEFIGIKLSDSLFEEGSRSYMVSDKKDHRLKSELPFIIFCAKNISIKQEFKNDSDGQTWHEKKDEKIENKKLRNILESKIKDSKDFENLKDKLFLK